MTHNTRVLTVKGFNKRVENWIDEHYKGNVSEAARDMGVPKQTLWLIYKGLTQSPSTSVLIRIAADMGCSIDFLLKGEK